MKLTELRRLLTPAGQAALAEADALSPDDKTYLGCFTRLHKRYDAELSRAALTTALLRKKARVKFSRAGRMYFEREALEQASGEALAAHRARRMRAAGATRVADLCCGLGGDAVALAGHADVVAVDLDPLRLKLCELNLVAHERQAHLVEADALAVELAAVDAVFVDPDRRVEGRRHVSLRACQPALPEVLERCRPDVPVCAKLAPGVPWAELSSLEAEAEFVSLDGELKECVLWLGPIRDKSRRATLLPSGDTLAADVPASSPGCAPPGRYLYDPDPAVVRAGLVSDLAHALNARQLDAEIAYLSGDTIDSTPWARTFVIEESLPFHLSRLRELLRTRGVGRVNVLRRGSAVDPEQLVRKLKFKGDESRVVVLTRLEGRPWALVCRA